MTAREQLLEELFMEQNAPAPKDWHNPRIDYETEIEAARASARGRAARVGGCVSVSDANLGNDRTSACDGEEVNNGAEVRNCRSVDLAGRWRVLPTDGEGAAGVSDDLQSA